jgi:hypothetical protein
MSLTEAEALERLHAANHGVRAELRWLGDESPHTEALSQRLAASVEQYRDEPFASILTFEIVRATGWSATGSGSTS